MHRLWNLLLVSCGGAPAFWKEEAASWRMGAEPGWLSGDRRTEGGGRGGGGRRQREEGEEGAPLNYTGGMNG